MASDDDLVLPFLQRAAERVTLVAARIARILHPADGRGLLSAGSLEAVRDAALSVAALDRQLTALMCQLLAAAGEPASALELLPTLVRTLQSLPPNQVAKLLPAGGLVSLIYHADAALVDTDACLQRLDSSLAERYGGIATGVLLLAAFLFSKRLVLILATVWERGLASGAEACVAVLAALLLPVLAQRLLVGPLPDLRRSTERLSIVIRLWAVCGDLLVVGSGVAASSTSIAATSGDRGGGSSCAREEEPPRMVRSGSYTTLIAPLALEDFVHTRKTTARALIEIASLPRAVYNFPGQDWRLRALKRGVEWLYATCGPVFHLLLTPPTQTVARSSLLRPVAACASALSFLVAACVRGLYFLFFPAEAEEAAARLTRTEAAMDFIKTVWRLADTPLMQRCAIAAATSSALPLCSAATIGDLPCVLLANAAATVQCDHILASVNREGQVLSAADRVLLSPRGAVWPDTPDEATAAEPMPLSHCHTAAAGALSGGGGGFPLPSPFAEGTGRVSFHAAGAKPLPRTLLYVHGGGFVGRMFASDCGMLARWTRECGGSAPGLGAAPGSSCGTPLLTVYARYSLSPEAAFPVALLQLASAYLWLRDRCERVAVAGESAGGNLAAALALWCLLHGVPPPAGLVLCYPALNLNPSPSPSRLLHLNDAIVPIHLLIALAGCYTGRPANALSGSEAAAADAAAAGLLDASAASAASSAAAPVDAAEAEEDAQQEDVFSSPPAAAVRRRRSRAPAAPAAAASPGAAVPAAMRDAVTRSPLVHPAYAPDALLARFPRPTHVLCGGLDPLLDDAVDLNTRLRRLGVPGQLHVQRALPHGFLNFPWLAGAGAAAGVMQRLCYDALGVGCESGGAGPQQQQPRA